MTDAERLDAIDRLRLTIRPCLDGDCAAEGRLIVEAPSGAGHCAATVRDGIDAAVTMNPAHFGGSRP